jgi:hypothetical protein
VLSRPPVCQIRVDRNAVDPVISGFIGLVSIWVAVCEVGGRG